MTTLWLSQGDTAPAETVVCLGFFDGVHLGHQRLIAKAVETGARRGLLACVHTFDVLPAQILRPDSAPRALMTLAEKSLVLASLGVDLLAVSRFEDTVRMRAEAFFDQILVGRLKARHIIAGFDHRFGYHGEGDARQLATLCEKAGIGLDIIEPVYLENGELISSTAIRTALDAGDKRKAEAMLGRPLDPLSHDTC